MWGGESREGEGQGPGMRVSLGLRVWFGRGRQVMSRWAAMGAESGSRPGECGEHLGPGELEARLNGEQGCGTHLLRVVGALLGPQFPQASWGSTQWPC